MSEFNELRKRARDKRDKAIRKAQDEYADTLVKIAVLEQDLLGRDPSNHRSIASCIESVIPGDRAFTTLDVMAGLEALDPGRVWRKRSIDHHLTRLRERGLVRRVKRNQKTQRAIYVRAGVEVDPLPFEDMTLPEVIYEVLKAGPMNTTELTVAILEAGYQTSMTRKALRDAVGVVLRGNRERFRENGGKWAVLS